MDNSDNYRSRKRRRSARERQRARQQRQNTSMATKIEAETDAPVQRETLTDKTTFKDKALHIGKIILAKLLVLLRDLGWYLRNNPMALRGVAVVIVVFVGIFALSFLFSGKIAPNISTMGMSLSGMSVSDAEEALTNAWESDITIDLFVDGDLFISVRPAEIGLSLDAESTAKSARSAGLSGIPFGRSIDPTVELDYPTAQSFLLAFAQDVDIEALNAGYEWVDNQVNGISGQDGRRLDVTLSLERLTQDITSIANSRRFNLLVENLRPNVNDPNSFLPQVQELVNEPFELIGYDPFTNQRFFWTVSPEVFVPWLEAGPASLSIRERSFLPFVDELNASLNAEGDNSRYILPDEAVEHLTEAIVTRANEINLRIRYLDSTVTIEFGDTVHAIARQQGVPFFLIEERNNSIDLDSISPGDVLSIPTRDVTMPHTPIPHKRIIVDLIDQHLYAFENGQVVFDWEISSGVTNAPTSPGIYQILNHDPVAYGSSVTLCDAAGIECGQWEMQWFMGIYQVQEGLVNGFHGDVLLPNGNWLGAGAIGTPATFGCVMSEGDHAQTLYDWAEVGTIVEIISNEFTPMSDLGQLVWNGNI